MRKYLKSLAHLFAIANLLIALTSGAAAQESATAKLDAFHAGLKERYPQVSHVSPHDLERMPHDDLVIFDVRETDEYNVSRIDGAIRVSPGVRASTFLQEHAEKLEGKTVVLYCSVGERSSRLAERIISRTTGAKAIYNLEGGLFKWHNEYRSVMNKDGVTTLIHPYSRRWGRLLERQDDVRMTLP